MQIMLHPHARDCCCLNPHQFSWPFQLYCEVYFKFQIFDLFLDRIVTLILIKSEILVREHSLFHSIYNYCLMNLCVYIPACHWCACVYVGEHICLWRSQVSVSSPAAHSLGYMDWLMSSKDRLALLPQRGDYKHMTPCQSFYTCAEDPNSGPYSCMVNSLLRHI